jgi:indolepyruvate decarboxylase
LQRAARPAVWAGEEVRRVGAQAELVALLEHTGYAVSTSVQGKGVVPERLAGCVGAYRGQAGPEQARAVIEGADVLLCLGVQMTDVNLGSVRPRLDPQRMVVAYDEMVKVKHASFRGVRLPDFIHALRDVLPSGKPQISRVKHPSETLKRKFNPQPEARLTTARFWERINHFLEGRQVILADIGSPMLSVAELYLPDGAILLTQAFYLSLGYTVPAALGAQLAAPNCRPLVFVGDGAFQMTAQEVSTLIGYKLNPVIFVINNDGYQIERVFRDGAYNNLQMWRYHLLPEVFGGGWGCEVRTEGELEAALARSKSEAGALALIEVRLDRYDLAAPLRRMEAALKR